MPNNIDDPYRGETPRVIWAPLSGDVGGLRQLDAGKETRENYWTVHKLLLEREKIGERLKDKKVIEIGPGDNVDFRDFCVDHGAEEYVGVDLFYYSSSPPDVLGKTKIKYYEGDMLPFLAQEASDSAIVGGFAVLSDEMIRRRECEKLGIRPDDIIQRVVNEIYRVLIPGEHLIVMGIGDLFKKYLLEAGFVEKTPLLFLKPQSEPVNSLASPTP